MRSAVRLIGLSVLALSLWTAALTPARAMLFGSANISATFNARTVSWRSDSAANRSVAQDVMRRVRSAIARYQSEPTTGGWSALLADLRDQSAHAKLEAVNRWVNRIRYVTDWDNWGVADYWESPAEMIARGGQCEDYALVKYIALRSLGFSPSAMRIVAVRDGFVDHAVLVVSLGGRLYMLDNLRRDVVESANAPPYRLIYALNEHGFWRYLDTESPVPQPPIDRHGAAMATASVQMPIVTTPVYVPTPGVRPITTEELAQLPQETPDAVIAAAMAPPVAEPPAPAVTPSPAPTEQEVSLPPPAAPPHQESAATPY